MRLRTYSRIRNKCCPGTIASVLVTCSIIVEMELRMAKFECAVFLILLFAAAAFSSACNVERRKSNAELGLNAEQAAGRKIYDNECDRCHEPYSTRGKKGPGLKGMFKGQYLSKSGLPANDDRVLDIIRIGRNDMPAFGQKLNSDEMQALLAYLHTL